ncbi:GMC family oxidoreductase N-terminal domain-containing protein [Hymenobacter properus]|uniref:GMC family oxidoreductase N-terminal domain-containing protein n=1 Tax=Hymenobacter properus TaxID=2791026 RepID=A0A931FI97_9BACT|nr:GMC family oxidoreductase N-terminal domain-containing protein [Hymenobacter properus]MBF9141822.1 GMC family oxidoreductase N-terminal domain-containing protein [Hymenobacter properus]MBR7720630.1 GMC family oxidoreductase N-terminal domain-containing protein [Microvirga sp. SRT04]
MFSLTPTRSLLLQALADTFIPPLPDGSPSGSQGVNLEKLEAAIREQPEGAQKEFGQLLDLLEKPLLGLTWFGPLKPFRKLDTAHREQLLQSWAASNVPQLRKGFQALRKLCTLLYYGGSMAEVPAAWGLLGYPGPDEKPVDTPKPIHTLKPTEATTYECEVLVIGSGAGGGVVAGELAEAGFDVLVLEKGPYCHGCDFTQREVDMLGTLYDAKGTLCTQDGSIGILAGACLGGGTTVNWAGAFRTPDYVLEEWAREHAVPHFTTPEFKASLDAVARAISVNTDYPRHNGQNQALRDGSIRLGQEVKLIPRNEKGLTDSDSHFRSLGYSTMGDAYGIKQGTLNTYLLTAFEHGARILADTKVDKVTVANGRATGAEAVYTAADGRQIPINVRAKRVVVAGGAIQTPALLLRSGLKHPHLGRHLHLHPTVVVGAHYPQAMNSWHGPSMSVVNDTYTRLHGTNFGAKLETPPTHPGLLSMVLPWRSGRQHHELLRGASHLGSFIVLTRDRDGGRVTIDKNGAPLIDYVLSDFDRANMLEGVRAAAQIHVAAGAENVYLPHGTLPTLQAQDGVLLNPALLDQLPHLSWKPNQFGLYSAHQMSTCRMGGDAATHPLRPNGETVEVQGLFVADGSAFPACSGVNPMLTIMALAHFTAQGMKAAETPSRRPLPLASTLGHHAATTT